MVGNSCSEAFNIMGQNPLSVRRTDGPILKPLFFLSFYHQREKMNLCGIRKNDKNTLTLKLKRFRFFPENVSAFFQKSFRFFPAFFRNDSGIRPENYKSLRWISGGYPLEIDRRKRVTVYFFRKKAESKKFPRLFFPQ